MSKGSTLRSRRYRADHGFTLVELLVVIVILGILSAVVVFAVRGSGDKGRAAAVQTDERTIRTALEVFCAQNGRYPGGATSPPTPPQFVDKPMEELVEGKYLSNTSEYHILTTGDNPTGVTPPPYPEGKCGGTPNNYKLEGPENGNSGTRTGTCDDPPATWRSNLFCPTGLRTGGVTNSRLRSPLQLPDGRVMAILHQRPRFVAGQTNDCGSLGIELYSPNTGKWTAGPQGACTPNVSPTTGDFTGDHVSMALISAAAGPCAPNCGKVLIYTNNSYESNWERWYLYNPTVPSGTVATALTEINLGVRPPPTNFMQLSLFQVAGPSCSDHCGEILIAGAYPTSSQPPTYRIFDPTKADPSTAFRTLTRAPFPKTLFAPVLVGLADGKILAFGSATESGILIPTPMAEIIDPSDPSGPSILPTAPPSNRYSQTTLEATGTRLSTNEVLATGDPVGLGNVGVPTAEIFDPVTKTWRTVPKCSPLPNATDGCYALITVGGKVLAKTGPKNSQLYSQGKMYLFDPGSKGSPGTWEKLAGAPDVPLGWAVTLQNPGCSPYCGKVLLVGEPGQPAYLFTP